MVIVLIVILPLATLGMYLQATSGPAVVKRKAAEVDTTIESGSMAENSAFNNDNFGSTSSDSFLENIEINPATGLLMTGGIGGIDAAGNPYGTNNDDIMSSSLHDTLSDLHSDHFNDTSSLSEDPSSITDDSFGRSSFDDW